MCKFDDFWKSKQVSYPYFNDVYVLSSNKYLKQSSVRFLQFLVCFSAEQSCFFQSIISDIKAFELQKGVVGQGVFFKIALVFGQ